VTCCVVCREPIVFEGGKWVRLARDRVGPMFLDEFTLDEWKNR